MTFLAEWGDRSQIATIALAASFNAYMVTLGACLGHFICTAAAVKLGEWISGKVTEKQILTIGGVVFIISGLCTAAIAIDEMHDGNAKWFVGYFVILVIFFVYMKWDIYGFKMQIEMPCF